MTSPGPAKGGRAPDVPREVAEGVPPPHDLRAEEAVLGAIMMFGREALDALEGILDVPENFYSETHRWIFRAAQIEYLAGNEMNDSIVILNRLKALGRDTQTGGAGTFISYITKLMNQPVVTVERMVEHAKIVRDRAVMRALIHQCRITMAKAYLVTAPEEQADILDSHQRALLEVTSLRSVRPYAHAKDLFVHTYKEIAERSKLQGVTLGIPTEFAELNRKMHGWLRGKLYIVAGRPGSGKSSFVNSAIASVIARGEAAAVFSLEMPKAQVATRVMCSQARVSLTASYSGGYNSDEWQALLRVTKFLSTTGIRVDDTPDLSFEELRSKVRRIASEVALEPRTDGNGFRRLALVVVDYVQLMRAPQSNGETRDQALGKISRGLKSLSKEFDLAVIAVAQLNRDVEKRNDKRPVMADLRECGSFEQDTDAILMLYRDEYYNKQSKKKGIAEIIIAKQRDGESGCTVEVGWEGWRATFVELPDQEYPE